MNSGLALVWDLLAFFRDSYLDTGTLGQKGQELSPLTSSMRLLIPSPKPHLLIYHVECSRSGIWIWG